MTYIAIVLPKQYINPFCCGPLEKALDIHFVSHPKGWLFFCSGFYEKKHSLHKGSFAL
jgi:hypothetical protein